MLAARVVHRDPIASLFICQRFSLFHFPMRTKALFDDIQSYSVVDFPSTKPPLNAFAILQVSGKLNLLMNLNQDTLIVGAYFNSPIDFIGGQ